LADGFASILKQAARDNPIVAHYRYDLIELNELRNAIVHSYQPDEPIATPCEKVVKRIEAIQEMLLSPPSLGTLSNKNVAICDPDQPIGVALKEMAASSFSQLPVYADSSLIGLLTADTIARWLGTCLTCDGGVVLDEVNVETVLQCTEFPDNFALLAPKNTVFDAVKCFRDCQTEGRRCDAILITERASRRCAPLGIITAFDMPKLYETIK
jgi:predicted transcriptional regulator